MINAKQALKISSTLKEREKEAALRSCEEAISEAANAGQFTSRIQLPSSELREYCILVLTKLEFNAVDTGNEVLVDWSNE